MFLSFERFGGCEILAEFMRTFYLEKNMISLWDNFFKSIHHSHVEHNHDHLGCCDDSIHSYCTHDIIKYTIGPSLEKIEMNFWRKCYISIFSSLDSISTRIDIQGPYEMNSEKIDRFYVTQYNTLTCTSTCFQTGIRFRRLCHCFVWHIFCPIIL